MDAGPCLAGYEGGFALADSLRSKAVHVCFAVSSCKGPGLCPAPWNHESNCRNLRDAMLGGLNKIDSEGVAHPDQHIFELQCDPDAGCFVKTNGYLDAWGRRYGANVFPPTAQSYLNDWTYNGSCNPAAISACPAATPTPRPTPVPTPSASPAEGDNTVPPAGVCPANYPLQPSWVGLGDKPLNVRRLFDKETQSYWTKYLLNVTPHADPPFCPHRGNTGSCEQLYPCALKFRVAAKAWGPGFNGDEVERTSRICEPWEDHPGELQCENTNVLNMIVSQNPSIGSPPGHYRVCVAPTEAEIGSATGTCREFDFTDK